MSGLEGLLAGRTLVGRYRIEEVIGRGGFAAVYRATDERLGRPVAVKVIALAAPDERTREELRARLQREARAAASLPQHPHVVTVHDVGTDPETGIDFLVMELLHGEDLASFLAREPRPPLELALRILRDATEGLAVGHRAGLIHRDVKPGNVFLARAHGDEPFRVCVLDFGIARVMEEEGEITRLTTGAAPHSPAYASPEQLRGERNLTAASDVFSLGVVAYLLLTGERPFPRERTAASPPAPPVPVHELNAAVPAELEAVVHRALAPEPGQRFADATEVARALDAALDAAPDRTELAPIAAVPVPPAPVEDRTVLQPPPRRPPPPSPRRSVAGMLALALVVMAGISFVGLWAFGRSERGPGPGSPATREAPAVGPDAADPAPGDAAPPAAGTEPDPATPPAAAPPAAGPPPGTEPGAIDRTEPPPMATPEPAAEPLPQPEPVEPAPAPAPQSPPRDTVRVVEPPPGPPPRVLGVPVPQARGRPDPPGRPPRRDTMEVRR